MTDHAARTPHTPGQFFSRCRLHAAIAAFALGAAPAFAQQIWTFQYSGQPYTFQVPAGVGRLVIDAHGGRGGEPDGGNGGRRGTGGRTLAVMNVTPQSTLSIFVGGGGNGSPGGGLGSGGAGGAAVEYDIATSYDGGSGGGGSLVGMGTTQPFSEYVSAGGGGGGGGNSVQNEARCGGDGGNAGNPPQTGERGCVEQNDQGLSNGDSHGGGFGGAGGGSGVANGGAGGNGLPSGTALFSAGGGGGGGGGYFVAAQPGQPVSGGGGGGTGSDVYTEFIDNSPESYQHAGGGGGGGLSYVGTQSGGTSLIAYLPSDLSDGLVTVFVGDAKVFPCIKAPQGFLVPAGVTAVTVDARGGQGGAPGNGLAEAGDGGFAGVAQGTVPVTPGELLTISTGCKGEGRGGFGGGYGGDKGDGDAPTAKDGAGGGGSSEVTRGTTPLIVAGGGGGGGGSGTLAGSAKGGDGGAGGHPSHDGTGGGPFGGGGAGNYGGCVVGPGCAPDRNGTIGGSTDTLRAGGGAGGGGGGYAGGRGGHGLNEGGFEGGGGGGGGGGQSYADPSASNVNFFTGVVKGDGIIVMTWQVAGPVLTVCPSGCQYTNLQSAIDAASDGTGIRVGTGTFPGNVTVNKSVVITGDGPASTILDGGGLGTVVTVANGFTVALQNVTITNGKAVNGGGVHNLGTLTLSNVVITGNTAMVGGGGISNELHANLTMDTGAVLNNTAGTRGAGILNQTGGAATLRSILMQNNSTPGQGGALAVLSGLVNLQYSGVSNNYAADGGGVYVAGGNVTVSNANVSDNYASQRGGAFFAGGGTLYADHLGVNKNGVGMHNGGGAFFGQRATVVLQTSAVTQNAAPQCVGVSGC